MLGFRADGRASKKLLLCRGERLCGCARRAQAPQERVHGSRGVGTMRDGYLQRQIPNLTHSVWSLAFGSCYDCISKPV